MKKIFIKFIPGLFFFLISSLPCSAFATETGSNAWEMILSKISHSLTGPVAYAISIFAIFLCGVTMAFADLSGGAKRFVQVACGLSVVVVIARDFMSYPHKTLSLIQAAAFLAIHKKTMRRRVKSGEIPGAKVGKSWCFLEEDLVTYLRSLYPGQASQGVYDRRKTLWHSTSEIKFIGLTSHTMESDYKKALGLPIK